jgi:hypothetical protein
MTQLLDTLRTALAGSISLVFLIGLGVVALAWVVNWFLEEIPLRKTHEMPAPAVERPVLAVLEPSEQVGD